MDIHAILVALFSLFCEIGRAAHSCPLLSHYEHSGICCKKCKPGTFVLSHCNETTETVCQPCKNGTFSEEWTSSKKCERCSRCQPTIDLVQVCNATVDNQCGCVKPNEFHHLPTDSCRQCTSCPPGQYPLHPCTEDTICSSCPKNYFSNVTRNYKHRCHKCTRCKRYSKKCSPTENSVCRYDVHTKKMSTTSQPKTSAESTPTLTTGKWNSTASQSKKSIDNFVDPIIIAVVCVIIVISLIFLVAILYFRRKKRALSDEYLVHQPIIEESTGRTFSFEGALLRDQSGGIILGLHKLLNPEGPNNWRALAIELGVEYSLIRNFGDQENINTATSEMLHHWSTSNEATVDKLYKTLRKLGRDDACTFLEQNVKLETIV